jgi:hypothetical protein
MKKNLKQVKIKHVFGFPQDAFWLNHDIIVEEDGSLTYS